MGPRHNPALPFLSAFSFYYIPLFLPAQSFRCPFPILQYRRIGACYLQFFPIPSRTHSAICVSSKILMSISTQTFPLSRHYSHQYHPERDVTQSGPTAFSGRPEHFAALSKMHAHHITPLRRASQAYRRYYGIEPDKAASGIGSRRIHYPP